MYGAVKLLEFDAERLRADYEGIASSPAWTGHHDYTIANPEDWTAIPLTSETGAAGREEDLRYWKGMESKPTEILKACPYFQEVIAAFKTEVIRARLLKLKAGTVIHEHRDYGQQRYSFERGWIRVHIPVITHEKVAWNLRDKTIPLKAGEAWYLSVCEPHSVRNDSDIDRIHVVLDMRVNDWMRELFPPLTLADRFWCWFLPIFEPPWRRVVFLTGPARLKIREWLGNLGLRKIKHLLQGG
jgi:quercetin dioxygenase-like cupin family protein